MFCSFCGSGAVVPFGMGRHLCHRCERLLEPGQAVPSHAEAVRSMMFRALMVVHHEGNYLSPKCLEQVRAAITAAGGVL